MWRSSKDAFSLSLQKAFSATELPTTLQPSTEPRASFELSSDGAKEDLDVVRARLSQCGLASSSSPSNRQQLGGDTAGSRKSASYSREELQAYDEWLRNYPSALGRMAECKAKLGGKRLAIFLDYDGTLTPIVANPDEAYLSQQMREAVRDIALLFPTAIISGRGREKVESFVQLKELYYAGSHGMDIVGPTAGSQGGSQQLDTTFQPAAHFRPVIDAIYEQLCSRLKGIPGASVEHNTFCVSAHFRNCAADRWHEVVSAVEHAIEGNEQLRVTRGRKVLEVRPKVNWNKGTALEHLLGMLGLKGAQDVVTLYIGDDQTDEDAFRVLKETDQGWGILVSKKPKETSARYTVRDPSEVLTLLQALVAWGKTEQNGWVQRGVAQQEQAQQQQQQQQCQHQEAQHQQHQHGGHWHGHSQQQQQQWQRQPQNQQPQQQQHPQSQLPQQQPALEHPHSPPFQHPHAQLQPPIPPYLHQQQQRWGAQQGQGFGRQSAGPPPPSGKKPNGFWCGSAAAAVSKGSTAAVGPGGDLGSHSKGSAAEPSACSSNGTQ